MNLWCIRVPKTTGGGWVHIPASSKEHAVGMASRWAGPAEVVLWPHDPGLHTAMLRGLMKALGVES